MYSRGLHTWVAYLLLPVLLVTLLLRTLIPLSRRKEMNTINPTGLRVFDLLVMHGLPYVQAAYITSQAAHETANFTSNVFRKANNLFGMKYAGQFLGAGQYNGYAKYNSIEDSVADYISYYRRRAYLEQYLSIEMFVNDLHRKKYFEAEPAEYLKGVKHFYNVYFIAKNGI